MSLDQLRYFVTVADTGTTRAAAQRLHISQPPLSRQIRALEDELGVPLFQRTPRGMHLLPAGEVLLDHARSILSAVQDAVSATRGQPADTQLARGKRTRGQPARSQPPTSEGAAPSQTPDDARPDRGEGRTRC